MQKKRWAERVAIHCNLAVVICILKHLQFDEYIFIDFEFVIQTHGLKERNEKNGLFRVPDWFFFSPPPIKINHCGIWTERSIYRITNDCEIQYRFTYFDSPKRHYDSHKKKMAEENQRWRKKKNEIELIYFVACEHLHFSLSLSLLLHLFTHILIFTLRDIFFTSNFLFSSHERPTFQWEKFSNKIRMNETFEPVLKRFREI